MTWPWIIMVCVIAVVILTVLYVVRNLNRMD
jgi:hypothetical protein